MEQINIGRITRFYNYNFCEGYAFAGHTHEAWEINIVLKGQMSITYGSDVMTLSEGDIFVGEPLGFHCNRAVGRDTQMAVVQYLDSSTPTGRGKGYSVRSLTSQELAVASLMISELEVLFDGNGEQVADDESLTNGRKLCEVLVSRVIGSGDNELSSDSPRVRLYREAVSFMEDNVSARLTIADISGALHVSPALLKRIFLEYTGGGIMNFFTEMKIRHARTMLEQGFGVTFVSDTLGFSSGCYFSSVFARVVGETPKRYQMRIGYRG